MSNKEIVKNEEKNIVIPITDVYETADEYTLKVEMPGVSKENLEITIENNELKLKGVVSLDNKKYGNSQLARTEYVRIFKVDRDIDGNNVSATLSDGILTLILHKSEEVKPKKILISAK